MYQYTYEEAVNRFIDTVYRLAFARTKSPENADDITQEVFLKLIQHKKSFESEEHLKAWLLRVTINLTNDLFASSWFGKTDALEDNIPVHMEEKSDLFYAMMELPKKYRTAIHLHYYEGYSVKEIALITKASEGTVKSQLHRGREMLKTILEREVNICEG